MKSFTQTPSTADAPTELFETGHLWLLELVDGGPLRFAMHPSGLLTFGDHERAVDDPNDLPRTYRAAIRSVRDHFDRDALRRSVPDPESVVFYGRATFLQSVPYDWASTPPFLGYDVWSGTRDRWLPPDAAEQAFERLGLDPVAVLDRERRARDFDPATYTFPTSAYADGPVAGVLIRNKAGGRAALRNPTVFDSEPASIPVESATALIERFDTPDRVPPLADRSAIGDDELFELIVDEIYRELPDALNDPLGPDEDDVRAALARQSSATREED